MKKFSLGKPIEIDGNEVIVVRDILGSHQADKATDTYSMVAPNGADGRPAIFVSENDLIRLRDDYPGMNVYGLWQLLFHNNAVKFGNPLIIFPLTDTGGLYLLMEGQSDFGSVSDISSSGEYINGYIPDNFDIDLATAYTITADLQELKLPPQPAYTRIEQSDKLKAENKRRWLVICALCGLFAVGAIATNYWLQTLYKSRMADYSYKKGLIHEMQTRVQVLSSERLVESPDDSVMIDQLYRMFELYPVSSTPPPQDDLKIGFTHTHTLVTPPNAPIDPKAVISGVTTELKQDLSYRVVLSAPPQAETDRSETIE
jgi:hypothetical protein